MFSIADGTAKLFGRDHGVREATPPWREQHVGSEDLKEELQGNSENSQRTKQKMTLKPAMTSGQWKGT